MCWFCAARPRVPLISSPGEVPGRRERAYDNFVERRHFTTHLSLLFTVSFPCLLREAVIEIVCDVSTYSWGRENERKKGRREGERGFFFWGGGGTIMLQIPSISQLLGLSSNHTIGNLPGIFQGLSGSSSTSYIDCPPICGTASKSTFLAAPGAAPPSYTYTGGGQIPITQSSKESLVTTYQLTS